MNKVLECKLNATLIRTKFRRFQTKEYGCYICWQNYLSAEELNAHLAIHLSNVIVKDCNASWRKQGKDEFLDSLGLQVAIFDEAIYKITNNTSDDITIKYFAIYNDNLPFAKINPDNFPITLKAGEATTEYARINGLSGTNHVIIVYDEESKKHFEKIQSYFMKTSVIHIAEEVNEVKNIDETGNTLLTPEPVIGNKSLTPEPGIFGVRRIDDILQLGVIPWYEPSEEVKQLCIVSFHSPTPQYHPYQPHNPVFKMINKHRALTKSNYFEILETFVQIEDYTARLIMNKNTKENRILIRKGPAEYAFPLSENEGRPLFLIKGDTLWVGHNGYPNSRFIGFVTNVTSEEVVMKLRCTSVLQPLPCYSIHFEVNRLLFQMERHALDKAKENQIVDLLFPEEYPIDEKEIVLPKLQFFDAKVKSDVNQISAVQHIVAGTSYPLPYLLIGFPGTGKTKVIVESICQLFTYPKNRILVCASSNNVCDEIAQKLISMIRTTAQHQTPLTQRYNILRLYANSVRRSCQGSELLQNSNFDEKLIPCLDEIYKYRIVVCTLTVAGRLVQGYINPKHFTHLFIDECESATETQTLIPIAGVCSSKYSINAHVILAGDPQQLGPIVRSNISKNLQLGLSMFHRMYFSEPYQKDTKTNDYNRRFISKLKNNYRSHPLLVQLPNKLFYNQEMRSSANPAHFKWLSELAFLPRRGFPIFFDHIEGFPGRKQDCVSWYNDAELESVLYYVELLLHNKPKKINQSDIGIISPYKRQCINIEEALEEKRLTDIEVGSVEQFQGKEKPVIIISTVRKDGIGFMQERERINVMITRAIGLLIIIGHKETLYKNADWKKVIDYTIEESGFEVCTQYDHEGYEYDYRC